MIPKPIRQVRAPKPLRRGSRRGKRTSKRRRSRLSLRAECDRRFAIAVKARDAWQCRACGSPYKVQCAHVVSRRYHATRWLLANAMALCSRCHMKWTNDPLGWDLFIEERLGIAAYHELKRMAMAGVRHLDYEAILASLPKV